MPRKQPKFKRSSLTLNQEVLPDMILRIERLHLNFSRYVLFLIHNQNIGQKLRKVDSIPKSRYTRKTISFTLEMELYKEGQRIAKAFGVQFSNMVEALVMEDLKAKDAPLVILLRKG